MSGDVFTLAHLDRVLAKIKDAGLKPMDIEGAIHRADGVDNLVVVPRSWLERWKQLSEETSMDKSIPTNGAHLIIGNGQPIGFPAAGLHATCPTCSRVFPIDVLDEGSARSDIQAYVEHTDKCHGASRVQSEG